MLVDVRGDLGEAKLARIRRDVGDLVDECGANPNTVAAFQCSVVLKGANLIAEDDEAYIAAATSPEAGFTLEAVESTPKLNFPGANDASQMQRWAAMQYAVGQTETEFDMASIVVPLPDNC